jgi:hypothetical protein
MRDEAIPKIDPATISPFSSSESRFITPDISAISRWLSSTKEKHRRTNTLNMPWNHTTTKLVTSSFITPRGSGLAKKRYRAVAAFHGPAQKQGNPHFNPSLNKETPISTSAKLFIFLNAT